MLSKRLRQSWFAQVAMRKIEQLRYRSPNVFRRRACAGNKWIAEAIQARRPVSIGKLGSTELQSLRSYLRWQRFKNHERKTAEVRRNLLQYSGVFPDDYDTFSRWGTFWAREVLASMTHLGVWFNFNESAIIRGFARNALVFHSYGLEPYIFSDPWSEQMAGKRVVVVSPFSATIGLQYPRREQIWRRNPRVLPGFELRTVQCPTYPQLVPPRFRNWFEALEDLKRQIREPDFDVLLVGAGAYSLPLCAYARSLGRVGVHLGGNLQLLFGILGKRWLVKGASIDSRYFNDSWVYPLPEETPDNCESIEGGCYWK